jgi:hypothetical protein
MTVMTKSQQATTRGRPPRVTNCAPWTIGSSPAGRGSKATCAFGLCDDRRVEIRSPALASGGNR